MILSDSGIILNSKKQGDTSKILTFFTLEKGIIRSIAKGARNPKNKLSSASDILNICEISYYYKKTSDLHLLSKSEKKHNHYKLYESFMHLNFGIMIAESVLNSLHDNDSHPYLYDFTEKCIIALNDLPDYPFNIFLKHQLILVRELGFEPDFSHSDSSGQLFNIEAGSFLESEVKFQKNSHHFELHTINSLILINNSELADCQSISFTDEEQASIIDFFIKYISYHLEKSFYYSGYKLIK